jgi:hypothetical protein
MCRTSHLSFIGLVILKVGVGGGGRGPSSFGTCHGHKEEPEESKLSF